MQSLSIDRKLSNLPLAITMGEPGGINSEIFLKAINEINKIDILFKKIEKNND